MRPVVSQRRAAATALGKQHSAGLAILPGQIVAVPQKPAVALHYASEGLGNKVAIVVGGAEAVLAEYKEAVGMCAAAGAGFTTLVTNDMIEEFTGCCDHAVTLHPDAKLPLWLEGRARRGLALPGKIWAQRPGRGVTDVRPEWGPGSVGLYAVKIALLELRLAQVLLCGVPMATEAGHFRRHRPWKDAGVFRREWLARKDEIAPCVRSFSGWTAELFSQPTMDFIKSAQGVLS